MTVAELRQALTAAGLSAKGGASPQLLHNQHISPRLTLFQSTSAITPPGSRKDVLQDRLNDWLMEQEDEAMAAEEAAEAEEEEAAETLANETETADEEEEAEDTLMAADSGGSPKTRHRRQGGRQGRQPRTQGMTLRQRRRQPLAHFDNDESQVQDEADTSAEEAEGGKGPSGSRRSQRSHSRRRKLVQSQSTLDDGPLDAAQNAKTADDVAMISRSKTADGSQRPTAESQEPMPLEPHAHKKDARAALLEDEEEEDADREAKDETTAVAAGPFVSAGDNRSYSPVLLGQGLIADAEAPASDARQPPGAASPTQPLVPEAETPTADVDMMETQVQDEELADATSAATRSDETGAAPMVVTRPLPHEAAKEPAGDQQEQRSHLRRRQLGRKSEPLPVATAAEESNEDGPSEGQAEPETKEASAVRRGSPRTRGTARGGRKGKRKADQQPLAEATGGEAEAEQEPKADDGLGEAKSNVEPEPKRQPKRGRSAKSRHDTADETEAEAVQDEDSTARKPVDEYSAAPPAAGSKPQSRKRNLRQQTTTPPSAESAEPTTAPGKVDALEEADAQELKEASPPVCTVDRVC